MIAAKRSREHVSPHITRNSSWVVQAQGLLIEKLSAMRCHTQTHVHTRPLSCSRMSPVLMKHSPYPLPSPSPHIPTKWVWWGSISQANRVRIVLLHSYLPSALQLSAYEDTGGVLSVSSPWLVVVFDCYSHLRHRLCKCFGGLKITFKEVFGVLSYYEFMIKCASSLSKGRISNYYDYQNNLSCFRPLQALWTKSLVLILCDFDSKISAIWYIMLWMLALWWYHKSFTKPLTIQDACSGCHSFWSHPCQSIFDPILSPPPLRVILKTKSTMPWLLL